MFDSGINAYRDDPFSDLFRGVLNQMLRSRFAASVLLAGAFTLTSIGAWNGYVDHHVVTHGVTESARVLNASGDRDEAGYRVHFAYRYGDRPDNWRVFESWWQNREPGVGSCHMIANPNSCRSRLDEVKVTYLADSPGVYVVEGAEGARGLMWIATAFMFLITLALLANWVRLAVTGQAFALPSWSDVGVN